MIHQDGQAPPGSRRPPRPVASIVALLDAAEGAARESETSYRDYRAMVEEGLIEETADNPWGRFEAAFAGLRRLLAE